jgi:methyl-accepting chemotaxis protein
MKLRNLLFLCCGFVSLISCTLVGLALSSSSSIFQLIALVSTVVLTLAIPAYYSRRFTAGLKKLERVLAGDDSALAISAGLQELDQLAIGVHQASRQWEAIAADSRRQTQEFAEMIQLLDQRVSNDRPDSNQLRTIMASLGTALQTEIQQCGRILQEARQQLSVSLQHSDSHSNALNGAGALIDQIAGSIHSIYTQLKSRGESTGEPKRLRNLQEHFKRLLDELEELGQETGRCERKLGGLSDPAKELSGTIQNIADLASRTDLLALNASIESIRAGEHGKGFAIVAEEVRKMAEQIADCTRELSSILDAMHLVITESSRAVLHTHERLGKQTADAKTIHEQLVETMNVSKQDFAQLMSIGDATENQRRLLEDTGSLLIRAMESAKSTRACNDSVLQAAGSMGQILDQAALLAHRFTGKKQISSPAALDGARPAQPVIVGFEVDASPVLAQQATISQ